MAVTSPAEWGTSSLETLKDKRVGKAEMGRAVGQGTSTQREWQDQGPPELLQPGEGGAAWVW